MKKEQIFKLAIKENPIELEEIVGKFGEEIVNLEERGMKRTPLMLAVIMERIESVKVLLNYNANPNKQDVTGKTVLHLLPEPQPIQWSRPENKFKIAELLFNSDKININLTDNHDNQPLWNAVFAAADGDKEKLPLVKLYLEKGANPINKNKSGNSPLSFAKKVEYKPLVELLEKYI